MWPMTCRVVLVTSYRVISQEITWKLFGATKTADGYWRIETDQEINDILK